MEAVFCVRAITDGVVPPTINLHRPGPRVRPRLRAERRARRVTSGVAMSNSFGFGGHDVSLVFRRYDA